MDKETLSNYGWIVICVLVITVMVALATPFGNYIKSAVENTTQGLYDTSAGAINSTDLMHIAGQSFEGNSSGSVYNHDAPELHPTDGIWEGSRTTPQNGDTYETDDYTYIYEISNSGWAVSVKDRSKTSYKPILESINGVHVTNMRFSFCDCESLTTAPTIPSSVTNMIGAFCNCTHLTNAPTIPSSVTNMQSTFDGCTSLTTAPTIPSSVTDMYYTFRNCRSLTTAPTIPSSVTDMSATFFGCTSLTTAPTIPSSVTNMNSTFYGCESLSGIIEVNANPSSYSRCLKGTQVSEITGDTTLKDEILQSKYHTGGVY